jgi:hypothetical protein
MQARSTQRWAAHRALAARYAQAWFFNGIHQGRYKFARYFSPLITERPGTWEALNNKRYELELYDLHSDPDELKNLAWTAADKAANEKLKINYGLEYTGQWGDAYRDWVKSQTQDNKITR